MNQTQSITIRTAAWAGDTPEELSFPAGWRLHVQRMRGHGRPSLSPAQIAQALEAPLGRPPLGEMLAGRGSACVIVDDLTRPTPARPVLEVLLPRLERAGLGPGQVSIVSALAAHHPLSRADWAAKVGPEVLERYLVFNHNTYENLVLAGHTELGTELWINREVMAADLRIGIGGMLPYWWPGVYSGGGKLILPGVAGLESIRAHHRLIKSSRSTGEPSLERVWANMHQAAEVAGLDCLVNVIMNQEREPVEVVAGAPALVHAKGAALARAVYATPLGPPSDVVVVNAYPQDIQIGKCFWGAHRSLRPGGTVVIVARHPEGISHQHFLTGRFGRDYGGTNHNPGFRLKLADSPRVLFFVRRKVALDLADMAGAEGVEVSFHTDWAEIAAELERRHGQAASATVYPYAAFQEPE